MDESKYKQQLFKERDKRRRQQFFFEIPTGEGKKVLCTFDKRTNQATFATPDHKNPIPISNLRNMGSTLDYHNLQVGVFPKYPAFSHLVEEKFMSRQRPKASQQKTSSTSHEETTTKATSNSPPEQQQPSNSESNSTTEN